MSKTRSIHHIVFATKNRQNTIDPVHKRELYSYIYGILKNKNCFLIRMNGISDHIHMLVDIHPSISLSDLVKEVKQSSSLWLRDNPNFPKFDMWGEGYFAESIGNEGVESCKQYILNQEEHHGKISLVDELKNMAYRNGHEWYDKDLA